ncbi:MAG: class I SAM-dependent methyltransferase, partial [Nitrososphaera sp.]
MDNWLSELSSEQRVLDLGAGTGSFNYARYPCSVFAVDAEATFLRNSVGNTRLYRINALSDRLPVSDHTFELVICHNTLEHFTQLRETLDEVRRVLKPQGRLFVSIPNGYGFADNLYRFVLAGGGHVNRFRFSDVVRCVEDVVGVRLVKWKKLYASFIYLKKPALNVLPHSPLRIRLISRLPAIVFVLAQWLLNIITRLADRMFHTDIALYGWALYFARVPEGSPFEESTFLNVCMHCGAGHPAT